MDEKRLRILSRVILTCANMLFVVQHQVMPSQSNKFELTESSACEFSPFFPSPKLSISHFSSKSQSVFFYISFLAFSSVSVPCRHQLSNGRIRSWNKFHFSALLWPLHSSSYSCLLEMSDEQKRKL